MTETAPVPVSVEVVPTTPYKDQKPGTSGLRKKTTIFSEGHYLHNFIQVSQPFPPAAILLSSLLSMLWVKRIIRVKLLLLVVMEGILLRDAPIPRPIRDPSCSLSVDTSLEKLLRLLPRLLLPMAFVDSGSPKTVCLRTSSTPLPRHHFYPCYVLCHQVMLSLTLLSLELVRTASARVDSSSPPLTTPVAKRPISVSSTTVRMVRLLLSLSLMASLPNLLYSLLLSFRSFL